MQAKISIIMPVKNAGLYLQECLDSILVQDFQDWELIAINDHSNDDSSTILKNYAEKDSRICTVTNNGKGIISALRLALKMSSGQFITRMDADDKMTKDKLALHLRNLETHGIGHISVGLVEYFSNNALGEGYKKYAAWLNELTRNENNFSEIYKECVIPSPNWMMHKSDLIACDGFEPNIYPEDYDLCFRMRQKNFKIKAVNKITHFWRDHDLRSSRTDENYKDNRFLKLKLFHFLKSDYNKEKSLVLWGAGKKGKTIAQKLIAEKLNFKWISNNPKKQNIEIHGHHIQPEKYLENIINPQCIIPIAAKNTSEEIRNQLEKLNISDYYFFC